MRRILTLLCTITTVAGMAQTVDPAGGCMYTARILKIHSALYDSCLLRGSPYSVDVELEDMMQVCNGTLTIKIGRQTVGYRDGCSSGLYNVAINLNNTWPGIQLMEVYYSYYPHPMTTKQINILRTSAVQGLGEVKNDEVAIYPTIASEALNVRTAGKSINQVRIVDVGGRQLMAQQFGLTNASINISNVPAGLHFVYIETPGGTYVRKIVISH